jgi:hypothetical protein
LDTNGCLFHGFEASDIIDTLTAVEELAIQKEKQQILIYPNPAHSEWTIQTTSPNKKVEIWSTTGINILVFASYLKNEKCHWASFGL